MKDSIEKLVNDVATELITKYGLVVSITEEGNLSVDKTPAKLVIERHFLFNLTKTLPSFEALVSHVNDHIVETASALGLHTMTWNELKDLIILVPQMTNDYFETCANTTICQIPFEEFGFASYYAVNLKTQLIYVSKEQFEKWNVSDSEVYLKAIENLKKLIPLQEKRIKSKKHEDYVKCLIADSSDEDINCSAIYIISEDAFLKSFKNGIVVSMPTRSQLFIAPLNPHNVSLFVGYTQHAFQLEGRYCKLSFPLVYVDNRWGAIKKTTENNNMN